MMKKLKKLIRNPDMFFYDMFAKRLGKPVYAETKKVALNRNSTKIVSTINDISTKGIVNEVQMINKTIKELKVEISKCISFVNTGNALVKNYLENSQILFLKYKPIEIISKLNGKITLRKQKHLEHYPLFIKNLKFINTFNSNELQNSYFNACMHIIHGQSVNNINSYDIVQSMNKHIYVCFGEDGFIHSVGRPVDFSIEKKYRIGRSLTLDFISMPHL